jgi:hypothetical protein
MIAETLRFLGVDASFQPDMSRRHLEGNRASRAMDFRERAYLTAFYRDDVRKLAQLLDCDLSRWES